MTKREMMSGIETGKESIGDWKNYQSLNLTSFNPFDCR
jgi:hypothetical protein